MPNVVVNRRWSVRRWNALVALVLSAFAPLARAQQDLAMPRSTPWGWLWAVAFFLVVATLVVLFTRARTTRRVVRR